ncbi:MAG: CPBP family glutamic-type intramembrane protease [Candidatus Omnitrophica bacterium]|nr:CPBP family glutamic-type intramembrane protease [Candidatus Omnitrophota bacterium]
MAFSTKASEQDSSSKKNSLRIRRSFIVAIVLADILLLFSVFKNQRLFRTQPEFPRPTTVYEWYRYAKYLDAKKRFTEEEKSLKEALRLDPNFYKASMQLGALYMDQGDFIKAMPLFEKALLLIREKNDNSNYEIALYNLGKICIYENKPDRAWRYLKQAYAMKKELGAAHWPDDPTDAVYYVMKSNNVKFIEQVNKSYPDYFRKRLNEIRRLGYFMPGRAIAECDRYLADNPGSRFTSDILTYKAWVYERTGQYEKAETILNSLKNKSLRKDQKEWVGYSRYRVYYKLKEYDKAMSALGDLEKSCPDLYSPVWFKYQRSLIYKGKKDYNAEKNLLQEIAKIDPKKLCYVKGGGRCSEGAYVYRTRQRLFEIYSAQGDYNNAFLQLIGFYKPRELAFFILGTVLSIGFNILLFLIFSRIFFYKKIAEVLQTNFRLRHLWLFWVLILLLTPFMQMALFSINYFGHNFLGRFKADPFIIGLIFSEIITVVLCAKLLIDKYKFDYQRLGFIWLGAKYSLIVPLVAVTGLLLFGTAYNYFLERILYFSPPHHPLHDFIEQFRTQGNFMQKCLMLTSMSIVGPISEEILFRIFLFLFLSQFVGRRSAVFISALVFACDHDTFAAAPYYLVVGIVLSIIYLRTKSIMPAIITHSLLNLVIFLVPA